MSGPVTHVESAAADSFVVGIDCGSQSAKVVVYAISPLAPTARAVAVALGQCALRPMLRPRPGVVVHPDDDLWDSLCQATRQAMAQFVERGFDVGRIVGAGLCTIRCCKAFLESDGTLVEPVISWMDDRAYVAYSPPDAAIATTSSGYLTHRLTGRFVDSAANNIDMQWPIDADTWQWSVDPAAFAACGVRPDQLVELQMPGDIAGHVTDDAAEATGLPAGLAIVTTANDKAVEMLGAGSLGERTALISLGTYICSMMHGPRNHRSPQSFWTNFAATPHRYLYESGGVRRGMWTLTWFLDLLGPELAAAAQAAGVSREQYLEAEAALVPAGSDGLMIVLDWLAPTDAPFRKGSMLGFDARHGRGHIYRAILEAIAMSMTTNIEAMCAELGLELNDVVISGGGSTSPLFMQIFADSLGSAARRPAPGGSAASLGSAICAAAGAGLFADVSSAADALGPSHETFTHDPSSHERYRQIRGAVYDHLRESTDPVYQRSHPLFDV